MPFCFFIYYLYIDREELIMKKSIVVGLAIFSLLTFFVGPVYAANPVLFGWTVIIPNQDGFDEFSPNVPLRAVKVTIMAQVGLSPSLKNEYSIFLQGSGPMDPPRLLNEDLTLEEEGVTDGSKLIIRRYP